VKSKRWLNKIKKKQVLISNNKIMFIVMVIDRYASPAWPIHRALTLSLSLSLLYHVWPFLLLYKTFAIKERHGCAYADDTRHHRAERHRQPLSQFRYTESSEFQYFEKVSFTFRYIFFIKSLNMIYEKWRFNDFAY